MRAVPSVTEGCIFQSLGPLIEHGLNQLDRPGPGSITDSFSAAYPRDEHEYWRHGNVDQEVITYYGLQHVRIPILAGSRSCSSSLLHWRLKMAPRSLEFVCL